MLAPAMAWCPALLTAAPRRRRGCLSAAGAPGSLLAAAPPRPPFPQALPQFLELRTRRLQFLFQPLLSLYRLAMHSAVIARLPALLYYLAPQLGYLAPACRRAAIRTSPESSHTSFLGTPFRLCPELPHRYTEYLRYDGEKRNPWNEMECGSNYARAMSSYALLLALSGFEFDMTKGEIGFHPKQFGGTHRFFWCLHSAWGTVELHADRIILSVLHGSISLRRFNAGALLERDVTAATLDGQELPYAKRQQSVILAEPAHLEAGSVLRLDLHNNSS